MRQRITSLPVWVYIGAIIGVAVATIAVLLLLQNITTRPTTMQLRVTRPGFLLGIQALAKSEDPVPHLPSIERWRDAGGQGIYDPNTWASRQELRSFVCAQCHVEYYRPGGSPTSA